MPNRRDLYRLGALALGGASSLALLVPGLRFLLDPLGRRAAGAEFRALTRLGRLKEGQPEAFAVVADRRDAWTKYPREPIGQVWLVRQPEGSKEPVVALAAECPHLGCPVGLAHDRASFLCPCHGAAFGADGARRNDVAARDMDRLEVELSGGDDPEVRVKFQRFQPQSAEKKPLA